MATKIEINAQIKANYEIICQARKEIATLKREKIENRSRAWADAQGTAKEKEDYVRSAVANIEQEIAFKEANIEYLYNMISVLNDELWDIEEDE